MAGERDFSGDISSLLALLLLGSHCQDRQYSRISGFIILLGHPLQWFSSEWEQCQWMNLCRWIRTSLSNWLVLFYQIFPHPPVKGRHQMLQLFSRSVMSDSFWPHGLQYARLPCPSPSPRVCSDCTSIESVMPSNHLVLCHPLLLLTSVFPNIRVFSNEPVCLTLTSILPNLPPPSYKRKKLNEKNTNFHFS